MYFGPLELDWFDDLCLFICLSDATNSLKCITWFLISQNSHPSNHNIFRSSVSFWSSFANLTWLFNSQWWIWINGTATVCGCSYNLMKIVPIFSPTDNYSLDFFRKALRSKSGVSQVDLTFIQHEIWIFLHDKRMNTDHHGGTLWTVRMSKNLSSYQSD